MEAESNRWRHVFTRNWQNQKVESRKRKLFRGIGGRCGGRCYCGEIGDQKSEVRSRRLAGFTTGSLKSAPDSQFECGTNSEKSRKRKAESRKGSSGNGLFLRMIRVRWSCLSGARGRGSRRFSGKWIRIGWRRKWSRRRN